jgi:hypothetical protein
VASSEPAAVALRLQFAQFDHDYEFIHGKELRNCPYYTCLSSFVIRFETDNAENQAAREIENRSTRR